MKIIVTFFLICTLGAVFAFPQKDKVDKNKTDEGPTEVRLNLSVVDGAQNYVNDITQADVKLYDDNTEQTVTYVAKTRLTDIAFVMDNTGSMRSQLEVEIALARSITANLGTGDEAMVVRFVGRDKITQQQPWTTNKNLIGRALDNLYIEGGQSAIIDGVYLAAAALLERAKAEKDKRFAIVLITDGEDRDSYYTAEQVLSLIKGSGIQIFAIALDKELQSQNAMVGISGNRPLGNPRDRAEKFLRAWTEPTGGSLYLFNKKYDTAELQAGVKALVTELRSPYVIGYVPSDRKKRRRDLRVEIADGPKGEKRTGTISGGFNSAKN